MSKINKDLLKYAAEVTDALNETYAKNHKIHALSGLGNLIIGLADIAINGVKAKTPLLGLYHLYQAAQRPKAVFAPSMDLDLTPRLRHETLPRPRP